MAAIMSTDEDQLVFYRPNVGEPAGWVFLVYGNDGYNIINSMAMKPVMGSVG